MLVRLLAGVLVCAGLCVAGDGARFQVTAPEATATVSEANYCFVKKRGILSEQMPVPTLTLQLKVRVAFTNQVVRPLILPIDHDRTVFLAMTPGVMKPMKKPVNLLEPKINVMARLPADVNPDNPTDPVNDEFVIVRAHGSTPLYEEEIDLPVYKKNPHDTTDLRGKRIYFKLQVEHQAMTPGLAAGLSDRWARFGVPWTGTLRTNMFVVDVPAAPQAPECVDKR